MNSLNDIVQFSVESNIMFKAKGISVELDFDAKMPKLYKDLNKMIGSPLNHALAQLHLEVEDAEPSRALYLTRYEEDIQKLMIYHDGKQIPPIDLIMLNTTLKNIAESQINWSCFMHGNFIAGQFIKGYGGRIFLENVEEKGYKVKTTVEIPVRVSSKKKS